MEVSAWCHSYFHVWQSHEMPYARKAWCVAMTVLSYFTLVFPLFVGIIYGIASLIGRVERPCQSSAVQSSAVQSTAEILNDHLSRGTLREAHYALLYFLCVDLINQENLQHVQPLGGLLPRINAFLTQFNQRYALNLSAIGSCHSSDPTDPWQTIKLIDNRVSQEGEVSVYLGQINDFLYEIFDIQSNGGETGIIESGRKKRTPTCFRKRDGTLMHPQLQLSLPDFRRLTGVTQSRHVYIQNIRAAWCA